MPRPPADNSLTVFGENVRAARDKVGITQERLGLEAGLHPTEVNRLERGRRNPGLLTVVRLARGLDVPASDLLRGL
jgi:transcriptional regulator with XRE-family HTH domain